MKKILTLIACLAATPLAAQDFSADSQARSWNLYAEVPQTFSAKVVDITCEITGDCAENCGKGKRQLGLLREADGVLIFPNKNAQTGFQGAGVDLLPFCEQMVDVDGLMLIDEDIGLKNIYQLQLIKAKGDTEWIKANTWSKNWAKNNPEAKGKGPWFRRDPRVNAIIAETGYLGIGLDHREAWEATQ